MKIGEIMPLDREITLNEGRKTVCIDVANTGDRPNSHLLKKVE